jgi:Oxidoreductase molybdopterin binding domain
MSCRLPGKRRCKAQALRLHSRGGMLSIRSRHAWMKVIVLIAAYALSTWSTAQTSSRPSEVVYVFGTLQTNRVLTPDDLRAMPAAMQQNFTQTRTVGGAEQRTTLRGVKLPALLEHIGLNLQARAEWKTLLVTATATDGYRTVFTWPELINTPTGGGVLLVYERDGQPLEAREGRLALLSTADFRLGARHVRNLLRIEVIMLSTP